MHTFNAALSGDKAAIEIVLSEVQKEALRAARAAIGRFGSSGYTAEDLSQLALTKAWGVLTSGKFEGNYADFVARVQRLVQNCSSKQYAKARRQKRDTSKEQLLGEFDADLAGASAVVSNVEEREQVAIVLDCAIDSLDRAIVLQFMEGYAIAEIGDNNEVTQGVISGRWKRIKARAAAKLQAVC